MLPMVNEADAMSAELDKKVKFELALVSPQARGLKEGKTEVQQCSLLFCGIFAITRLSIVRSNSKGFNQCCCQHYCPISSLLTPIICNFDWGWNEILSNIIMLLYKWLFMLVVMYVYSMVKQYTWVLNMRKNDLPL